MRSHSNGKRRKVKPEAERPFWISYADLMTAMMVLFLAAMAVTIAAVTRKVSGPDEQRNEEILAICGNVKEQMKDNKNVEVDCTNNRISFGEAGRFATNSYKLPEKASEALATLVPVVLEAADGELGQKWMKQIVVEGYTDTVGGYLYNLHLSLLRSEWVLCLLMDPRKNADLSLTAEQLNRVRQLFLAGGVSFNGQRKGGADESRRVELRIQFFGLKEERLAPVKQEVSAAADMCQL